MSDTPNTSLSETETKAIIEENHKTIQQEATEIVRYPGLKLLSKFMKTLGIALAIVSFVFALIMLFVGSGWDGKLLGFLGALGMGIIYLIIGLCIGDFCQVLVDIEENTRK